MKSMAIATHFNARQQRELHSETEKMAYGNYGAFVYHGCSRDKNREDQTPYKESEAESGYHQAFGREKSGLSPKHAVLGSGPVRLCAYKTVPLLYLNGEEIDLEGYKTDEDRNDIETRVQGEVDGYRFAVAEVDRHLYLRLIEPDGSAWFAKAGFEYGDEYGDAEADAGFHTMVDQTLAAAGLGGLFSGE